MIFELVGLKFSFFCLDDMGRQVEHVLGDLLVLDLIEIVLFVSYLVRIAQRHAHHSLAARFQRNHVLARGEDHLPERHHSFLANGLANDCESLLTDLGFLTEDSAAFDVLVRAVDPALPKDVRAAAISALEDRQEARAIPVLQRLVNDSDPDIREAATEALQWLQSK